MKILLIGPQVPRGVSNKDFVFPLALLYLASALRFNGDEVSIFDLNTIRRDSNNYEKQILQRVSEFKPAIVGISCLFSGQFPDVRNYAEIIKKYFPGISIVIGGMHPTIYAKSILEHCSYIDFIVLGEGEITIVEMVNAFKRDRNFSQIDGFAYRRNDIVILNKKTKFVPDLDRLPLPAYDLINHEAYKLDTANWFNPKGLSFNNYVPIISSRSCPRHCNFCSMFMVMGPRWRNRSPQNVVMEMQILYEYYGQRYFAFMDDNLTLNRKHVLEICRLIKSRGLIVNIDTPNGLAINSIDEEVLDALVEAGLIRTSIAIESGSEFIRNKVMKKRLSNEKIYEVIRLTKKYKDLYVRAFFIIGMPEETRETLFETEQMIKDIDVDGPHVIPLVPFPGTPVFAQALRDNLFVEEIDMKNIWQRPFFFSDSSSFFIRPYAMTLDDLKAVAENINATIEKLHFHKTNKKI